MSTGYDTLIVTFGKSVKVLDSLFEDTDTWGVATLKEWVDAYESTRFVQVDAYTAVITSEYNMKHVREWLERYLPIDKLQVR